MLPIKPHIWFDENKAAEAAEFYVTLLPDSSVNSISEIPMGEGKCDLAEFTIAGQTFMGISAGPGLKINPSISFFINFDPSRDAGAKDRIDEVWNNLADGGTIMMPLDKYPFSERYGWLTDKYGVPWQLILTNPAGEERPVIVPSLMFTQPVAGRGEEAIDFYTSIFKDGKRGNTARREQDMGPDKEGTLLYADFHIHKTWFAAMDSAYTHGFAFNDAVSLLIPCQTQEEIDYYWSKLTEGGQPGNCGWLKDKYGVSWQVTSTLMTDTIAKGNQEQSRRLMDAFMQMKKVDIAALKKALAY